MYCIELLLSCRYHALYAVIDATIDVLQVKTTSKKINYEALRVSHHPFYHHHHHHFHHVIIIIYFDRVSLMRAVVSPRLLVKLRLLFTTPVWGHHLD